VQRGFTEIPLAAGLSLLGTLDYVIDRSMRSSDPVANAFAEVLRGFANSLTGNAPGT
jgi:hypothetical protein